MPCIYTVDEKDKIIHYKINGPVDITTVLDRKKESYNYALKCGIRRFCIDLTEAQNTANIIELYTFAHEETNHLANLRFKMRLALLVLPGDNSFDMLETVMYNAGHQVKQFTDHKEALGYLKVLE